MRFKITWRDSAYKVSIPNYAGGEVVTLDEVQQRWGSHLCSHHSPPDPLACDICDIAQWDRNANQQRMKMLDESEAKIKQLEAELARLKGEE